MLLPPVSPSDFALGRKLLPNTTNEGFTEKELLEISPVPVDLGRGSKSAFWRPGRKPAPEIGELKSEFGYQTVPVLTDLIAVAQVQNTELAGLIQARVARYNFYIMRCGVFIAPQDGEKFEALKFEVRYGRKDVSTYSMLPGPETRKILEAGGKLDIGVTGKVDFSFPDIPLQGAEVNASAKAALEAKFIVSFNYELKTQVVDAFGIGTNFCRWFMHRGDKLRNDVVFYPIVMTPKDVTDFDCEFRAYFQINHNRWREPELFLAPPLQVNVQA
jgi:hypothetical protein